MCVHRYDSTQCILIIRLKQSPLVEISALGIIFICLDRIF